jgi:hypothetical protein
MKRWERARSAVPYEEQLAKLEALVTRFSRFMSDRRVGAVFLGVATGGIPLIGGIQGLPRYVMLGIGASFICWGLVLALWELLRPQ